MYVVSVQSLTIEDETDSYKQYIARTASAFVYEKLQPLFEEYDVVIGVSVLNEQGRSYYLTSNGEVVFDGYQK